MSSIPDFVCTSYIDFLLTPISKFSSNNPLYTGRVNENYPPFLMSTKSMKLFHFAGWEVKDT